ncbi:TPA: hypothetical protein ACUEZ3_000832 [Escherichia coli]
MAINNFKPFALDPNANVTSQADWEALPALLSGFTAGKASSAQVNKAIRQASFIAAALAQYTANKSGLDVLDDGDLNGFISKMRTAFGKDFQALDATLTALAGLATGANKLPYFTGTDTAAQTDLTSVGRDIIGKNTIADILTYLGVPKGVDAQMVQARVHFNGHSGTIISGFNISSITKLGAGRYTVNFTTPLPNANYTATSSAWNTGGSIVSLARIAGVDSRTATNFGVSCMDNTSDEYADSSNIDVIVVGGV